MVCCFFRDLQRRHQILGNTDWLSLRRQLRPKAFWDYSMTTEYAWSSNITSTRRWIAPTMPAWTATTTANPDEQTGFSSIRCRSALPCVRQAGYRIPWNSPQIHCLQPRI